MALPTLRADGTLPPWTHRATLTELTSAFDKASSATHTAVDAALRHAVTLIWSADMAAITYVGGSYVTEKRYPGDLDLAVRSDVWSDVAFDLAFSAAYPSQMPLVDVFFNRTGDARHMEEFFREIVGAPTVRKGIVEIIR